jgi:hypothetical protein
LVGREIFGAAQDELDPGIGIGREFRARALQYRL